MTVQPGQPVPAVPVKLVDAEGISDASSADILGSGTVVFFAVPGAFTPTCHLNHLPGFVENAEALEAAGATRIVCAAVNDHHVVKAWAEATGALGRIDFIADAQGRLARALGLDQDLTEAGLGVRFTRASLLIRDGVVAAVNRETERGVVRETGASSMLEALQRDKTMT